MTGPAVRLEGVTRRYRVGEEEVAALDGVDLEIAGGSLVALTGPSGSGKSTLTAILAGLERPTSGRVLIGDLDLVGRSERELLRLRATTIAVTVQRPDRNLLGYGTALDNVRFAQRGADRSRRLPSPAALLDRVGLARVADRAVNRLSGGERQRLALAVGLASGAGLLLLDEPTSQLDEENRDAIATLLLDLHAEHRPTLLAVTHDERLAEVFERVVALRDGRIAS